MTHINVFDALFLLMEANWNGCYLQTKNHTSNQKIIQNLYLDHFYDILDDPHSQKEAG